MRLCDMCQKYAYDTCWDCDDDICPEHTNTLPDNWVRKLCPHCFKEHEKVNNKK